MDKRQPRESIARLIALTARQWRRALDIRLQRFGLTEATWLPLLHLARAPEPMRQKELAASLALDGSTVARLLDGLQASGLIERREDSEDRRAKTLILTQAGRDLVERVESVSRDVRLETLAGFSDDEIAAVTQVLERISGCLSQLTENEA